MDGVFIFVKANGSSRRNCRYMVCERLLNSNSYCILDGVCGVPLAVHSCSNCNLVGHAGCQVLGSYIVVSCDIGSLYSPFSCQVYSDAVLVSTLHLILDKLYLVILCAVIDLNVLRIIIILRLRIRIGIRIGM